MVMVELDIGTRTSTISGSRYWTNPSTYYHSGDHGGSFGIYIYGDNRSGYRSHTSHFSAYNHSGQYISYPRFPLEDILRGVL